MRIPVEEGCTIITKRDNDMTMSSHQSFEYFVNKETDLRFNGISTQFALSHSLFSSFDIDSGTRLLLKTIAQQTDIAGIKSVLDIGSGVGAIGIAIACRNNDVRLHAIDRDALALLFTSENALRNSVNNISVTGSIGLMQVPPCQYDLVVSNLPAKAGNEAIKDMIMSASSFMNQESTLAVVIVRNLVGIVENAVRESEGTIFVREETKDYSALHIRGLKPHSGKNTFDPYIRGVLDFFYENITYRLTTVYGISEFDTLNYSTAIMFDLIEKIKPDKKILIWNPGQGHAPVFIYKTKSSPNIDMTLASRDLLSLTISKMNCEDAGMALKSVTVLHIPSFFEIEEMYDHIIIFPDSDPGLKSQKHLLPHIFAHLNQHGSVILASKSSQVFGIINQSSINTKIVLDKKEKGFRAVALKRKGE
jgi:16S rRNA G1207 methylase RsmC